jgi:hypothetical protein
MWKIIRLHKNVYILGFVGDPNFDGFGIFEKVDKDLGLSRGTAWDASGWKDYCDFGFGDV